MRDPAGRQSVACGNWIQHEHHISSVGLFVLLCL